MFKKTLYSPVHKLNGDRENAQCHLGKIPYLWDLTLVLIIRLPLIFQNPLLSICNVPKYLTRLMSAANITAYMRAWIKFFCVCFTHLRHYSFFLCVFTHLRHYSFSLCVFTHLRHYSYSPCSHRHSMISLQYNEHWYSTTPISYLAYIFHGRNIWPLSGSSWICFRKHDLAFHNFSKHWDGVGYWNTLRWRCNGHGGVSNHQPHDCLLKCLFRHRSKKTSKLCVTGLSVGNSPGPVNSPHKGPVTRKMFPFDDVIMTSA